MADALCGPSTPLQSFKNHSQVDRTLQQDRLTGARHPLVQGFRTADPRAGSLDAEFAAFEAGPQQPFYLQQQSFPTHQSFGPPPPLPQSFQQDVQSAPRWAADFRKSHLGSAQNQPMRQHQFRSEAPTMRSNVVGSAGGRQNNLMRQQQPYSESNVSGTQPLTYPMAGLGYLQGHPISQYQFSEQQPGLYQEMQYPVVLESYRDTQLNVAHSAAFDAAFAQAEGVQADGAHALKQSEIQPDLPHPGEVAGVRLDPIFNTQTGDLDVNQRNALQPPENDLIQNYLEHGNPPIRIGSDTIPHLDHKAPRTSEENSRDHDELARTAGQLVNSMSGETSSKFENSQFLALMRKIRDRRVEVRGDKFHDVDHNASTARTDVSTTVSGPEYSVLRPPPGVEVVQGNTLDDSWNQLLALEHQNKQRLLQAKAENQRDLQDAMNQQEKMTQRQDVLREGREEMMREAQEDIQGLHPGGRGYPVREDEDRHKYDHWASGGIGVEDERIEENHGLAGRFQRVTVEDHDEV